MANAPSKLKANETTVLAEILFWGCQLSSWKQHALGTLISNKSLTEQHRVDILRYCKLEHEADAEGLPVASPRTLDDFQLSSTDTRRSVQLLAVRKPQNINALCPEQELTFAPEGLTVVFGYNASGKSGYGRILRRVCRGRQKPPELKPNVLKTQTSQRQSVEFQYRTNGSEKSVEWGVKSSPPNDLSCISIFDSECAAVHVTQKNTLAFYPSGLEILPAFAELMKDIQERLKKEKAELESLRPRFLSDGSFSPTTSVGRIVTQLRSNTDTVKLEELAGLSSEEQAMIAQLQIDLAKDPRQAADDAARLAGHLKEIGQALSGAMAALGAAGTSRLSELRADVEEKREAAEAAAQMNATGEVVNGLGSDAWKQLWTAARAFSTSVFPDKSFPVTEPDAKCVLCQQPLSDEARGRLQRFEDFVQDSTQKEYETSKKKLDHHLQS